MFIQQQYQICYVIFFVITIHYSKCNILNLLYELTNNFNESIPDTNQYLSRYDFIIIGSGSGGSVMANRLSENKNWNILLLEAGEEENFLSDVPLTPGATQITKYNWGYKTERQAGACTGLINGVCNWPKGRALGGTSVINFLIYQRGHKEDFNEWARLGNYGWSYDEVLPYFIKSEKLKIASNIIEKKYHGIDGYLDIQNSNYKTPLVDAFIAAGLELGYRHTDPNGESLLGFSRVQATLRNGRRCSAAKAFLRPIIHRSNLHISMRTRVTKILIDSNSKTAVGVEFLKNRKRFRVFTRKEIILSAGSIASPQLLMLSGIGPADHLRSLNIPVIMDLKVGYNLQDHVAVNGLEFLVNQPITIDETNAGRPINVLNYVLEGKGPFTIAGGAEGLAFLKLPNSSFAKDYPDIEIVIGAGGLGGDKSGTLRNMLGISDEFYHKVYQNVEYQSAFGLVPVLMRPNSRGRISLKSNNPFHWPRIEPNFYTKPQDLKKLIQGVKLCFNIASARSFKQFGTKFHSTPFPGCELLTFKSDAYWECCIRKYASSLQHQVGTCKMGPAADTESVVNPKLQVHGVQNLRVVDASIMPNIPAAHTNAATYMIGEKGADMVKEYWKKNII